MENLLMKWRTSEAGAAVMMCGGWCIFGENVWPANCSADGSGTEYKHCGKLNELLMKWLHYAFRYCGFCIAIDAFSRDLQTRIWWNSTEKRGANTM